jgi:hypothetical protein
MILRTGNLARSPSHLWPFIGVRVLAQKPTSRRVMRSRRCASKLAAKGAVVRVLLRARMTGTIQPNRGPQSMLPLCIHIWRISLSHCFTVLRNVALAEVSWTRFRQAARQKVNQVLRISCSMRRKIYRYNHRTNREEKYR